MCESPETHTGGATIEARLEDMERRLALCLAELDAAHGRAPRLTAPVARIHSAPPGGGSAREEAAARVVDGGDARPSLRTTRRGALGHVSSDQGAAIVASGTGSGGGGIYTSSQFATGLYATSGTGWAIYGQSNGDSTGTAAYIEGTGGSASITTNSVGGGTGVVAASDSGRGVVTSTNGSGSYGINSTNWSGAVGSIRVFGQSLAATGGPSAGTGVKGLADTGFGVYGRANSGYGVVCAERVWVRVKREQRDWQCHCREQQWCSLRLVHDRGVRLGTGVRGAHPRAGRLGGHGHLAVGDDESDRELDGVQWEQSGDVDAVERPAGAHLGHGRAGGVYHPRERSTREHCHVYVLSDQLSGLITPVNHVTAQPPRRQNIGAAVLAPGNAEFNRTRLRLTRSPIRRGGWHERRAAAVGARRGDRGGDRCGGGATGAQRGKPFDQDEADQADQ